MAGMDTLTSHNLILTGTLYSWRKYVPSIRISLAALVVGCILPIALVAAYLILRFYDIEHTQVTARSINRARAMVTSLDRDFTRTEAGLQALATSHRLVSGDLKGFYVRALEVLENLRVDSIVVVDLQGQLLLSTRRPLGSPLPKLKNIPLLRRVQESGEPGVSDLYIGPIVRHFIYTVAVPVKQDGSTVLLLNAIAAPERIAGIVKDQALPASWTAIVADSSGSVVAHSHDIKNMLGKKINPDLLMKMAVSNEGAFETNSSDGVPVVTVYSRSPRTGWVAVLEMPLHVLQAGLRNTLSLLITATITAMGLGLLFAWFVGGRIARSITALTKPALALATGETLVIPPLQFKEANEVGKALLDASAALRQSNYDAHHDILTGLPNRAMFHIFVSKQLALCQREKTELSLLYIDLDGFKAVNDIHGHAIGDQVLREVSLRIGTCIRASDIAARFGGDEFAIALVGADMGNASFFADRLIDAISRPYLFGAVEAKISASIGVAVYPASATDIDTLTKKADQAMYTAKASGKKRYCVAKSY